MQHFTHYFSIKQYIFTLPRRLTFKDEYYFPLFL